MQRLPTATVVAVLPVLDSKRSSFVAVSLWWMTVCAVLRFLSFWLPCSCTGCTWWTLFFFLFSFSLASVLLWLSKRRLYCAWRGSRLVRLDTFRLFACEQRSLLCCPSSSLLQCLLVMRRALLSWPWVPRQVLSMSSFVFFSKDVHFVLSSRWNCN